MDDNIFTNDQDLIHFGMTQDEKIKTLLQRDHVRRSKFLDVKRKKLLVGAARTVWYYLLDQ